MDAPPASDPVIQISDVPRETQIGKPPIPAGAPVSPPLPAHPSLTGCVIAGLKALPENPLAPFLSTNAASITSTVATAVVATPTPSETVK